MGRTLELSAVLNLSAAENLARSSGESPVLLRRSPQAGYRVPKLRSGMLCQQELNQHSATQRPAAPIGLSGFLTILQRQNLKSTGVRLCMTEKGCLAVRT